MSSRADYIYGGDPDDEQARVTFYMTLFNQVRSRRLNFETQWEEAAAMAWPEYRSSFYYGRDVSPGQKWQQFQVDSSASVASHRFGAIVDYLLTPSNMMWAKVEASNPDVMKDRAAKAWFAEVTKTLWRQRYASTANFTMQNQQNMQGLGVFGNMGMFIDELDNYLDPRSRGLRYLGLPVGEIYLLIDHQRRVAGFIRHFRLNAQQAIKQFYRNKMPHSVLLAALEVSSQQLFDFLHFCRPRDDYNPFERLGKRGFRYESCYLFVQGYCLVEEGGYRTLPLAYGRYMVAPDEDYGRGPAQMVLASLKTLNAAKRDYLTQAHRAGSPAYLVADTGLTDLKTHSGAFIAGGMSADGKPLIGILPTGQIQVTQEMMQGEDGIIKDAFLVGLFQMILADKKNDMGPRQVVEYVNERGILLAPTVGGICGQYLGPLIDRELDILSRLRLLPPMPQILREARADYEIKYTAPLARAMQSQESAGYVRTMEFAGAAIQAGADPELFDIFDLDTALPAMGEQNNAPLEWFADDNKLGAKRKARAQAQERENQVKELPGRAAIIKAQAIGAKAQAGQNTGGTLSGTPEGGMPQMPGQQAPGGRAFGQPGAQPPQPGQGP